MGDWETNGEVKQIIMHYTETTLSAVSVYALVFDYLIIPVADYLIWKQVMQYDMLNINPVSYMLVFL